jgi:membrane associated rhomboid family serine protease
MQKVSAGYFIIMYFIAELTYAILSLVDQFSISPTAHFSHVGGFLTGILIVGIFKGVKGESCKKKEK